MWKTANWHKNYSTHYKHYYYQTMKLLSYYSNIVTSRLTILWKFSEQEKPTTITLIKQISFSVFILIAHTYIFLKPILNPLGNARQLHIFISITIALCFIISSIFICFSLFLLTFPCFWPNWASESPPTLTSPGKGKLLLL